ncbi:hypothetical protein F5884DRAFT_767364, partial [Xylogone sp. PMI_703]
MSSKTFHLDLIRLSCPQDSLQLSLSSSATFRAISDEPSRPTPQLNVADLISRKVWVCRGHGCAVDIRISFAGAPLNRQRHVNVVERLGHHLLQAPLWSQLNLQVKLEIHALRNTPPDAPDISIYIGYGMPSGSATSTSALKPPRDVPCADFEKLSLELDFEPMTLQPSLKKLRLRSQHDEHVPRLAKNNNHVQLFEDTIGRISQNLSHSMSRCFDASLYSTSRSRSLSPQQLDLSDDEMIPESQSSESVSPLSSQPPYSSSASTPSSSTSEQDTLGWCHNANASCMFLSTNLPLACRASEHALKTLISGSRKASQGCTLTTPPLSSTLSSIAPSIWSPGFSESIVQNARFLPIVSRSVSRSWAKNVQSPSLRRKLEQLTKPLLIKEKNEIGSNSELTDNLEATIKARLWSIMQHNLYDPAAARRLNSMSPSSTENGAGSDGAFVDLLGATVVTKEGEDVEDSILGNFVDFIEEGSIYDDLLLEDQYLWDPTQGESRDENLGNFEEMERILTEKETNDMLLEDRFNIDIDTYGLSLTENENML